MVDDHYEPNVKEHNEKLEKSYKAIKIILNSTIDQKLQRECILPFLIWSITKVDGAKHNVRCWSKEAYNRFQKNKKNKEKLIGIHHEHVMPIKKTINRLFVARGDDARIDEILKKIGACLVTVEEHNKLEKLKKLESYERYKKVKVKILDMSKVPPKLIDINKFRKLCKIAVL